MGFFTVTTECPKSGKMRLYISSPLIANAMNPITPPFDRLRNRIEAYSGKPIAFTRNKSVIDVGKVPVQVWSAPVKLILKNGSGNSVFTRAEDWSKTWIVIRDSTGSVVWDTGLSLYDLQNNISADGASMALGLPEGSWTIELSPRRYNSAPVAKATIAVSRSTNPVSVELNTSTTAGNR
jgi:hypothetical protein